MKVFSQFTHFKESKEHEDEKGDEIERNMNLLITTAIRRRQE